MTSHWTEKYLGKPWVLGATGPDTFDCWGLVECVMRERFNTAVPAAPGAAEVSPLARHHVIQRLLNEAKSHGFERLDVPSEGSIVVMSRGTVFDHVGLWVDGKVLHCSQAGGVTLATLPKLKSMGLAHFRYYAHCAPS